MMINGRMCPQFSENKEICSKILKKHGRSWTDFDLTVTLRTVSSLFICLSLSIMSQYTIFLLFLGCRHYLDSGAFGCLTNAMGITVSC